MHEVVAPLAGDAIVGRSVRIVQRRGNREVRDLRRVAVACRVRAVALRGAMEPQWFATERKPPLLDCACVLSVTAFVSTLACGDATRLGMPAAVARFERCEECRHV